MQSVTNIGQCVTLENQCNLNEIYNKHKGDYTECKK